MARGTLHTTTVRFDTDTWGTIVAGSDRLGIAHAEYIRGAVLRFIGPGEGVEMRLASVERLLDVQARHIAAIARVLRLRLSEVIPRQRPDG
jgi:hypothetical protein